MSRDPLRLTSDSVRVVKVGGRAQSDAALAATVARAWEAAPGALVVVHGGGDEVSALQRLQGATPAFVAGRRVTSAADLDTLRMALSGAANKRLVAQLGAEGVEAVGLSGEDAGLVVARRGDPALGEVGVPDEVNARLLSHLLAGGFLPVVSPVSRRQRPSAGADPLASVPLNVNGDDAAAAIAAALGAAELLLVADVAGVLEDGALVPELDAAGIDALVARGAATGGMIAKLEAALAALAAGVFQVRIGDVAAIADPARGTRIVRAGRAAMIA